MRERDLINSNYDSNYNYPLTCCVFVFILVVCFFGFLIFWVIKDRNEDKKISQTIDAPQCIFKDSWNLKVYVIKYEGSSYLVSNNGGFCKIDKSNE